MKFPVKTTVAIVALGIVGAVGYPRARAWWKARSKPNYRQAAVTRGDIASMVNATGTVQPVLRVQVGAMVSGPIVELLVYHTDKVKFEQKLAQIDPRIYEAAVKRDEASLETRDAEVRRVTALLKQAQNEEQRAKKLLQMEKKYEALLAKAGAEENPALMSLGIEEDIFETEIDRVKFISDTEWDQVEANRLSLEAQLAVARAGVKQAQQNLEQSKANLAYTVITSPDDGYIIDCKIEKGQTLIAQFQTPELFVVAPELDQRIHVYASVDEADIGMIRKAKEEDRPVHFTVDAYPDDLFEGEIYQIRFNPTSIQNVVTYPVIVEVQGNEDLKLLPGMTANLSFEVDQREGVLKIPNAALRFYPKPEQVRKEDKKVLEGGADEEAKADEEQSLREEQRPAKERAKANRRRVRRHVWILEGELLKAVRVETGLSDYKWTELISGELKKGQKLVTGVGPPKP